MKNLVLIPNFVLETLKKYILNNNRIETNSHSMRGNFVGFHFFEGSGGGIVKIFDGLNH